ncbi:MAG: hypothetical protein JWM10_1312, partial [Myxococcaceae bacterium]|nr:hypothetical protein [Myxococcaceae bacterium]
MLTHIELQIVWPGRHRAVQNPSAQACVLGHTLPQRPQFDGSSMTPTQRPPQSASPSGQVQRPPLQVPPQVAPHAPQLASSLAVFTQVAPQRVWPAGHAATHAPAVHAWPAAQARPQAPQLAAS